MALPLQATLLRVLQERRFTRLGGSGEVPCDVRVVAATNRELLRLVSEGGFREDLYYRLNVVPIEIPPLRQRREDVPLLAKALCERAARRHGIPMEPLLPAVLRCLMEHTWPGNVRELANAMERLVLLADEGHVSVDDLPAEIRSPAVGDHDCPFQLPASGVVWEEIERGLLRQAMDMANGNRAAAARLLGLSYKAFLYRLDKHDMA
jgi:two-component system NtrC family response regulator